MKIPIERKTYGSLKCNIADYEAITLLAKEERVNRIDLISKMIFAYQDRKKRQNIYLKRGKSNASRLSQSEIQNTET
jgi:hypothetical protein